MLIQNALSKIGIIKEEIRQVNLNADRKRLWLGKIGSMDEDIMNESVPLSLGFFKINPLAT